MMLTPKIKKELKSIGYAIKRVTKKDMKQFPKAKGMVYKTFPDGKPGTTSYFKDIKGVEKWIEEVKETRGWLNETKNAKEEILAKLKRARNLLSNRTIPDTYKSYKNYLLGMEQLRKLNPDIPIEDERTWIKDAKKKMNSEFLAIFNKVEHIARTQRLDSKMNKELSSLHKQFKALMDEWKPRQVYTSKGSVGIAAKQLQKLAANAESIFNSTNQIAIDITNKTSKFTRALDDDVNDQVFTVLYGMDEAAKRVHNNITRAKDRRRAEIDINKLNDDLELIEDLLGDESKNYQDHIRSLQTSIDGLSNRSGHLYGWLDSYQLFTDAMRKFFR
jgi:uncharacterized phage infection (PIP) family protein YhgE